MAKRSLITCKSFDDVVRALGGLKETQRITGRNKSTICNWRVHGERFPATHYAIIASELYRKGFYAPWPLFRFNRIDEACDPRGAA